MTIIFGELDLEWSLDRAQVVVDLYFFDIDSENNLNRLRVKSLDVVLTERCSLKCADFSNLMQHHQKLIGAEVEVLVQRVRNFLDTDDYVSELRLIGGEPLVSKNAERVLDTIYEYSKFNKIVIYTNGTVAPKESLLKRIQAPRVWVKISDYGPVSRKAQKVANTCESCGINCIHEQVTEWEDVGRIIFRGRTDAENKVVFGNCCVNDTLTLLHGQLYACPFSAHTDNLGVLESVEGDKVGMLEVENLRDKIRSIYKDKDVLVACNLCNGSDHIVGKVVAGVQTKDPLKLLISSV